MEGYYTKLAAAYIRGYAKRTSQIPIREELMELELDDLLEDDLEEILQDGKNGGAKLYAFKDTHTDLPRVRRVLGFLKSVQFESLLDIGSGRGVFLFPFLQEFPWVDVTSADILDYRVEFLQDISSGGIANLKAVKADLCSQPFPDKSVDVVTLLEVLEHIPDVRQAVKAAAPDWQIDWDGLKQTQLQPYFEQMADTHQNPIWHGEDDVWTHTMMVCTELTAKPAFRVLEKRKQQEVFLAALLHDIGKDTWIQERYPDLPVISLDVLRKQMNVSPKDDQGAVANAAKELAKEYLRKKQPFVWNATNTTPMIRGKQIQLFENYRAAVQIDFLETGWGKNCAEIRRERKKYRKR